MFRFWPAGAMICLGSALLGSALATGGYELESTKGPDAAAQAIRLKVGLLLMMFFISVSFFTANLLSPQKYFQIGRLLASGIALAEVCPMTPMPGLRIYQWRRTIWAILFALIVPAFFLMNFIW